MTRNTMWKVTFSLFVLLTMAAVPVARAEEHSIPDRQLAGKIDYRFVGHLGETDEKGRLHVWQARVEGDIEGTMKWWFVNPPPIGDISDRGGRLTFYVARWELWVEGELLLAGESGGKTNFREGADGIWDGHGRVTEAGGKYALLKGRSVYETGPVIVGSDPPKSFSGTGMFLIY